MVGMNRNKQDSKFAGLMCPETELPLEVVDQATLSVINERINNRQLKGVSGDVIQDTFGTGLIQRDREIFYPIKEGIPLLLVSDCIHYNIERYGVHTYGKEFEQISEQVIHESEVYDNVAEVDLKRFDYADLKQFAGLRPGKSLLEQDTTNFPEPMNLWADAGLCQYYAYKFLTPCDKKCYLQLGGHGSHAIKFLLAGAKEAVTVDPSFKSLIYGRKLSGLFGVEKGFKPVKSCGEFIPYPDNYFDYIYAGGVLHHTDLRKTAQELYRVLKKGGKGAFVEPLEGSFLNRALPKVAHAMHIRLSSKEEAESIDHPLYYGDVNDFLSHFDEGSFREFGLFMLPATVLSKFLKLDRSKIFNRTDVIDEFLLKRVRLTRRFAGIVTILVEKK
jgi:SAM-dependent methyltransferase/uncharacterized protein YbaR (Trm112 family)